METEKKVSKKVDKKATTKREQISLAPLDFEQALDGLLQTKPEKINKPAAKKKSQAKEKK